MDLSYLFHFGKICEEHLISSTISSCLAINDSQDIIYEPYDILYFEMPKLSILDEIIGKIFILERKYKIKHYLSEKCEYITKRYVILKTTRLNLTYKMLDCSKVDIKKNYINMDKNKSIHFLIAKTKSIFEVYYLKYSYYLWRLDNLFNKKIIKIRGDTKSINKYSFVT